MNKSGQTGPRRSLEIILVLLLRVKFSFYSQKQPLPNERIDLATGALALYVVFLGFQCISSKLIRVLQRAARESLTWRFLAGNCWIAAVLCHLSADTLIKSISLIRACLPPGSFHYLDPSGSLVGAGSGDLRRSRSGCLQEEVLQGAEPQPQGAWGSFRR